MASSTKRTIESDHPWAKFLEARMHAMAWLRADGADDAQIAKTMSMDPVQVHLILMHYDEVKPLPPPTDS